MNEFKIGERVFSYSMQEWGVITKIIENYGNVLKVIFDSGASKYYTYNGKISDNRKAPDLFYDKVAITSPPKPLQDKDIVLCWDNTVSLMSIAFYDAINKCTFNALGARRGRRYDNMLLVENPPQYMLDIRNKLDD